VWGRRAKRGGVGGGGLLQQHLVCSHRPGVDGSIGMRRVAVLRNEGQDVGTVRVARLARCRETVVVVVVGSLHLVADIWDGQRKLVRHEVAR
jgi:hypothetical protein